MTSVTIIGGGPAGCATALALFAQGITDITVVEAGHYAYPRIGESIPPNIRPLFAQLGILDTFLAEDHAPCVGSCSSWGDDVLGYNDFIANPHGSGWHLDRRRFEAFLADEVTKRGMRLLIDTRFRHVTPIANGFCLQVSTLNKCEQELKSDYLIDAGGMQALLATRLGAKKRTLDQLLAVCAVFDLGDNNSFSQLTMLEAVEYGWWYAARLPDKRVVVAIASDAPTLKSLGLTQSDSWQNYFQQTRHVFPALREIAWTEQKLTVLLAASTLLEPSAGSNWLAVGDAASCFDPISSQGIYKAFANGIAAAQAIAEQLNGNISAIDTYRQQVSRQFVDYLSNRQYFYEHEQP